MKIFIRKKGKWKDGEPKFIIEGFDGKKSHYLRTIPKAEDLLKLTSPGEKGSNSSSFNGNKEENKEQNFALSLLSEHTKEEKKRTITEEERKLLEEISK